MVQDSLELAVAMRLRRFQSKDRIVDELCSGGFPETEARDLVGDVWLQVRDGLAQETLRDLARNLVFLTVCAFMTYLLAANPVSTDQISLVLVSLVIFGFLVGVFALTALLQMGRLVVVRMRSDEY